MRSSLIPAVASLILSMNAIASGTPEPGENVLLYLRFDGKTGKSYQISDIHIVVYPERKCGFSNIPRHEKMVAATYMRYQQCAIKSGNAIYLMTPSGESSTHFAGYFAAAKVGKDGGTAVVTQPGFDSSKARNENIYYDKRNVMSQLPGAPLPARH